MKIKIIKDSSKWQMKELIQKLEKFFDDNGEYMVICPWLEPKYRYQIVKKVEDVL